MKFFINVLRIVGCINVFFIAFNGSYRFDSDYFSNTALIVGLLGLAVLSFAKDLVEYVGVIKIAGNPINHIFRLVTILVSGILSSFVVLIPKLLLIEGRHLDSMSVKFTVRITRLWNKEEMSFYLSSLVEERGVSKIISELDQNRIVESSNSMSELRNSLNILVDERLESLKSDISGRVVEIQTVVQEPSWFSENTVFVAAVSVIAVVALVGVGYLLYTSYGGTGNSGPAEPVDDGNLRDIEDKIAQLSARIESKEPSNIDEIVDMVHAKAGNKISDVNQRIDEIEHGLLKTNSSVGTAFNNLAKRVTTISKKLDDTTETVTGLTTKTIIASGRAAKPPKDIGPYLEALTKKVNQEHAESMKIVKTFEARIGNLENTKENMLKSSARFVNVMVDKAKDQILNSDEFAAMGILLQSEAIRDILAEVETKNFIEGIKGKKS